MLDIVMQDKMTSTSRALLYMLYVLYHVVPLTENPDDANQEELTINPEVYQQVKSEYARFTNALYSYLDKASVKPVANLFTTNIDTLFEKVAQDYQEANPSKIFNQVHNTHFDCYSIVDHHYMLQAKLGADNSLFTQPTINYCKINGTIDARIREKQKIIVADHDNVIIKKIKRLLNAMGLDYRTAKAIFEIDNANLDDNFKIKRGLNINSISVLATWLARIGRNFEDVESQYLIQKFLTIFSMLPIAYPIFSIKGYPSEFVSYFTQANLRFSGELNAPNSVLLVCGVSFSDQLLASRLRQIISNNPNLEVILFPYNQRDSKNFKLMFNPNTNTQITIVEPQGKEDKKVFSFSDFVDLFDSMAQLELAN